VTAERACETRLAPAEVIRPQLGEARDAGFQACVHAIGDRANTMALDAMEKIGVAGRRFRILLCRFPNYPKSRHTFNSRHNRFFIGAGSPI